MKPEDSLQIAQTLGNPGLQFKLGQPLCGPAFSRAFKSMASLVMLSLIVWGARVIETPQIHTASLTVKLALTAILAMIVLFYYYLMVSRTRISATEISQTWLADKHVRIAEITKAKFIYIPYLSWLFAPRMVVRTQNGFLTMFYAADPKVLAAFAQLAMLTQGKR